VCDLEGIGEPSIVRFICSTVVQKNCRFEDESDKNKMYTNSQRRWSEVLGTGGEVGGGESLTHTGWNT